LIYYIIGVTYYVVGVIYNIVGLYIQNHRSYKCTDAIGSQQRRAWKSCWHCTVQPPRHVVLFLLISSMVLKRT
jgi:hypothetical protein